MIDDEDSGSRSERAGTRSKTGPKHARSLGGAPAPVADEPLRRGPPEFAANVQVTETEREWIREHLGVFHKDELILDVVRRIKAGKEATVYACTGHPSTGRAVIAAKLYRERSLRSVKNTTEYQQGRSMLDEEGKASWRLDRSGAQKSKRGKAVAQVSWLMHEYTLLETLHAQGGDVPQPLAHNDQGLLLEFIGDDLDAAPTLNDVELDAGEAQPLFERVLFNIELMLGLGWIHGDLSAYNILYQPGTITIIDFAQAVDPRYNLEVYPLLLRDVERVCRYFARYGVTAEADRLASAMWNRYLRGE
jgi:RIO kinase 1